MTGPQKNILPSERIAATSRRALAITMVAVIASGLLFNGGVSLLLRLRPELDNPTYIAFSEQWHRLDRLREPVGTLIVGDSSGRHGVVPDLLDPLLETESVNICTIGDAAVINVAWQLESYIERFGPPQRVIMVMVHDAWKRDIKLPLLPLIPLPWDFWTDMRASMDLDRRMTRDVFLARYVPVYSKDLTVQEILMHPWRTSRRQLRFGGRGYLPIPNAAPKNAITDAANHRKWTAPDGWQISAQSRAALNVMIAMAGEHGFGLYVANSPQLAGMLDDDVFGPYYRYGQEILAGLVTDSPRSHLVLSPPAEYPPEQMQNSDHIVGAMAEDYTRRLAAAVIDAER